MIKKFASLFLCGLMSFSLVGMQVDPSGNYLGTTPPVPTLIQKLKASAKLSIPASFVGGIFGFAFVNTIASSCNALIPFDKDINIGIRIIDPIVGLAGLWLTTMYLLPWFGEYSIGYSFREPKISCSKIVETAWLSSLVLGVIGGAYTGFLVRDLK